jgi:hypothetical protein
MRDRDNCSVCGLTRRVLKAGVIGQHNCDTGTPCAGSKQPPADYAPVIYVVRAFGDLVRTPSGRGGDVAFLMECSRGDLKGFNDVLRDKIRDWNLRHSMRLECGGSLLKGRVVERLGREGDVFGASLFYSVREVRETNIPRGPYLGGPFAGRVRALEPADPIEVRRMSTPLGRYERDGQAWKWVPAS